MSKSVKRTAVRRAYDDKKKSESTAGLMALRVTIVVLIIAVLGVTGYYAVNEFMNSSEAEPPLSDADAYYQKFDSGDEEKLLEYYNNSVTMSDYYKPELVQYNDIEVSPLMLSSLEKMVQAAKDDGINLNVTVGYMSYDECQREYNNVLTELEQQGNSSAEAEAKAREIFPEGNANEFRTGMLIKISDMESEAFSKTDAYNWLYKNGINYGFINRYTQDKTDYTSHLEDLTVYRFVGTNNAQKMRSFAMCLEEYSSYCSYH